ncbi:MAG: SpoIIE family protein phosphatase [Bacteroidetes bacterium]|nr:SpoIIE family protein phosphatase [Bacteroidota bacterium]
MKKVFSILLFFFAYYFSYSQNQRVFKLDSLPVVAENTYSDPGLLIDKNWIYKKGDDSLWSKSEFDDSKWDTIVPDCDLSKMTEKTFSGVYWFRIHLHVDTSLLNQTLALMISQNGASEFYLNGKLIHKLGKINTANPAAEIHFDPQHLPLDILFTKTDNVIAVRYANSTAMKYFNKHINDLAGFDMKIGKFRESQLFKYTGSLAVTVIFIFYFTFFIALSILHFMMFLFYRANKANLFYSIFSGAFGTFFGLLTINLDILNPDVTMSIATPMELTQDFYMPALFAMLYTILNNKIPKIFWLWISIFIADFVLKIFHVQVPYRGIFIMSLFAIESLRIIITAIIKKRDGAWIIGVGIITTVLFLLILGILNATGGNTMITARGWMGALIGLLFTYATIAIPLSMSVYLARDSARTNKKLQKKLIEVEDLSAKSIAQEKEKQEILAKQKENLEIQVTERTKEVVQQKKVIEEKNKDITDSINYAKRIQDAILPSEEQIKKMLPESFVLFKPKDIVSGDFYFFSEVEGKIIVAAVDCTGHGVPGAVMSMVGHNHLKRIVSEQGITDTSKILDELHKQVLLSLNRDITKRDSKDGMDAAIISINKQKSEVQFSGAVRPLYYFVNGNFNEVKGERYSIAGVKEIGSAPYASTTISISEPTTFYLFSDGFADQFSPTEKKLMTKKFKEVLMSIQNKSMAEQKKYLNEYIENWRGSMEQTDDIMVIGIKIL